MGYLSGKRQIVMADLHAREININDFQSAFLPRPEEEIQAEHVMNTLKNERLWDALRASLSKSPFK